MDFNKNPISNPFGSDIYSENSMSSMKWCLSHSSTDTVVAAVVDIVAAIAVAAPLVSLQCEKEEFLL